MIWVVVVVVVVGRGWELGWEVGENRREWKQQENKIYEGTNKRSVWEREWVEKKEDDKYLRYKKNQVRNKEETSNQLLYVTDKIYFHSNFAAMNDIQI